MIRRAESQIDQVVAYSGTQQHSESVFDSAHILTNFIKIQAVFADLKSVFLAPNKNVVLNEKERLSCHGNDGNKDIGLEVEGNKGVFGNCDNKECRDNCGTPNNPMVNELNKEEGEFLNRLSPIQNLNSYALVVKVDEFPKDLEFIPTVISESGIEVVIFDEDLMQKGSERWSLTFGGQFVGFDMHISKLRYNLRRMWGKYGIDEIDKGKDGHNLGKPIVMDSMTTSMCYKGIGNLSYARVLVEMEASRDIKNEIEIQYMHSNKKEDDVPKEDNSRNEGNYIEDVLEDNNGTAKVMADNVFDGMNTSDKQNEVMNLIISEGIKVCSILETRLKRKKLQKTCDRIIQGWDRVSNMKQCSKDCRIMVGWDPDTSVQVELEREKKFVNGKPWCIAGDINVTLYHNEHSCGSSVMTFDMVEFQDCLNTIEVEDVIKGRSNRSKILSLSDDARNNYENEQIPQLFFMHFKEFLGKAQHVQDIEEVSTLFQRRINEDVAFKMTFEVTNKEIKEAMFDIRDSKAYGPDGFSADFFKKAWSIIGPDICNAISEFFYIWEVACWDFLKKTLKEFGFHEKMVHWILQCVTTAGFTLNVNGERIGYFKDLKFQYHFGCKTMKLVHVCFADDLLVMCHGDCDSVNVSKKALDEFSKCSELLSNNSKSTVFFGGLCVEDRQAILSVLPFAVGTLPVRDIYEARLKHDLTVGYMISNGQWLWPEDWVFKDVIRTSEDVFKSSMEEIRHKLLGLTIKDSKAVRDVEEKWKVSCIKPSRDSNGVFRLRYILIGGKDGSTLEVGVPGIVMPYPLRINDLYREELGNVVKEGLVFWFI
nr:hypothetical protein [Tanacetum cinerariifolium]